MVTPSKRTALLAGATGLVGGHCLALLLDDDDYGQAAVLGRREVGTTHRKLVQRVVDFDRLADLGDVPRVDDVLCCLGTTIKHTGSEEAFRRVDVTYVHELARPSRAENDPGAWLGDGPRSGHPPCPAIEVAKTCDRRTARSIAQVTIPTAPVPERPSIPCPADTRHRSRRTRVRSADPSVRACRPSPLLRARWAGLRR